MSQRLNLMAPEVCANPYPVFAELRRSAPVCQVDPGGMWAVSRYEDVMAVLKDPHHFSSSGYLARGKPDWLKQGPFGDKMLTAMDPPEHLKLRNLVSRAFGTGPLSKMEGWIRGVAGELAERVVREGEVELVSDFTMPLPAAVISRMLGLDLSLRDRFKRWADDYVLLLGTHTPEQIPQIRATLSEMEHYLDAVIETSRRAPSGDMMSELVLAEVDGRRLSHAELLGSMVLLLLAGLETTMNLLGNSMVILSEHPHLLERVLGDPGLLPAFIEEVLRYESPAQLVFRQATVETALPGGTIPAGGVVMVLLGSAGRDERHFEEPDVFKLGRDNRGTLPFGYGNHFCLGAQLARMEARLGLEALLSRIRGFTRVSSHTPWRPALNARGPLSLPLRFERA